MMENIDLETLASWRSIGLALNGDPPGNNNHNTNKRQGTRPQMADWYYNAFDQVINMFKQVQIFYMLDFV